MNLQPMQHNKQQNYGKIVSFVLMQKNGFNLSKDETIIW
jgi:hypothetical protein